MMLLLRCGIFFVLTISMTACGFRPLYAPPATSNNQNLAISDEFRAVSIARIPDEAGVILNNYLIDRLYLDGPPDNPAYRLNINLTQSKREIGILSDDTATRAQLILTADARLTPIIATATASGAIWARDYSTIASYNILENQFATQVAQEDALDRGLRRLGDQITQGLALYFQQ
jgi:hypothetical protein